MSDLIDPYSDREQTKAKHYIQGKQDSEHLERQRSQAK
jgi:hypothetical protein